MPYWLSRHYGIRHTNCGATIVCLFWENGSRISICSLHLQLTISVTDADKWISSSISNTAEEGRLGLWLLIVVNKSTGKSQGFDAGRPMGICASIFATINVAIENGMIPQNEFIAAVGYIDVEIANISLLF